VVGLLCVLVDLTAYRALRGRLGWGASGAKAASYLAGVAAGFVLNKRWTFESRRRHAAEAASYLTLYAATLGVNVLCNAAALRFLGAEGTTQAFFCATLVTTVLNFLGLRLATFRRGIDDRRQRASGAGPLRRAG
jgi:putative flippase GtrA